MLHGTTLVLGIAQSILPPADTSSFILLPTRLSSYQGNIFPTFCTRSRLSERQEISMSASDRSSSNSQQQQQQQPSPPSWDAYTVEYEKRVEPFTSQFAEVMMRPLLVESNGDGDRILHVVPGGSSEQAHTLSSSSQKRRNGKPTTTRLLDVGCGTGATSLLALSNGLDVTATDVSSSMVDRTRNRAQEAGYDVAAAADTDRVYCSPPDADTCTSNAVPSIRVLVRDGQSLPTEFSNTFDVAVANFSVIFFPNPVAGVKEMFRCLVPGGTASFTAWGNMDQTPAFRVFPDVAAELVPELVSTSKPKRIVGSTSTLTALMEEAGFVDIKVVGPVTKVLEVPSPEEYYNRFALTSPPTAEMISKMEDTMKITFRNRVMATAKARGGRDDGSIALNSSAFITYGRKP
mmetsp:Transcript_3676/g.7137  ORF Transcript_3676/g.7137 Transcript_3676/m.7137 type:complete len:404 (-) Transcript_3676:1731-2942(-)